jgi:hypothetical protein
MIPRGSDRKRETLLLRGIPLPRCRSSFVRTIIVAQAGIDHLLYFTVVLLVA